MLRQEVYPVCRSIKPDNISSPLPAHELHINLFTILDGRPDISVSEVFNIYSVVNYLYSCPSGSCDVL